MNDLSVRGESFGKSGIELSGLSRKWREILREDLFIGKELGSGAFGVVFKGVLTSGRSEEQAIDCAVKMLKGQHNLRRFLTYFFEIYFHKHSILYFFLDGASDEDYKDLYNELLFMASVEKHKNIVNLLGACTESGKTYTDT